MGLGSRVSTIYLGRPFGSRVKGLGSRVHLGGPFALPWDTVVVLQNDLISLSLSQGLGCRVSGRARSDQFEQGIGLRAEILRSRVEGLGFRV